MKVNLFLYAIALFLAFFYLLPIWSCFTASVKTVEELSTTSPLFLPWRFNLENYIVAYNALKEGFLVSVAVSTATTILSLFFGSVCAFTLTKFKFKWNPYILGLIGLGVLMPFNAYLIPTVLVISAMGLYDTIFALIVVHFAFGLPTTLVLFTSYYLSIPDTLIEAAKLDGASDWKVFSSIISPLSGPIYVVVAVLRFTFTWNDLFYGLILTKQNRPIMTALAGLKGGEYAFAWNYLMAGTLLAVLPVLIVYILLGKYLIRGYMSEITKVQ